MCGICGVVQPAGVTSEFLAPMLQAIAHRGPDDEGVYCGGPAGLGSRRLSIIDVAGGHQPISNEDGSVWIVFNGAIYNYRELRKMLRAAGHEFRTDSDTEVIVHLYEMFGPDCVTHLRGMFAFAIWDERTETLFIARDHLGQKPLFYHHSDDQLLFGSEIKSVLAAIDKPRKLNLEAIHHYLSLRFIPPPQTMLQGIYKLPPAHTLTFHKGELTVERYWSLSFKEKSKLSYSDMQAQLRSKLTETVDMHLVSDVPLGAFLSGGMDSSMMVAIMAQDLKQQFKTFAVGVEEQDFNELPFAKIVAEHHETEHIEQCVEANLIQLLPTMIWHLDEPSDPIAACQFFAAQLASQHVKVVVGGDGGDELFAGFDRYIGVGYLDHYARIPSLLRNRIIDPILTRLPDSFAYKNMTQQLRWANQLAAYKNRAERYAAATIFFRFAHAEKAALFGPEMWRELNHIQSSDAIVQPYEQADGDDPIDRMLYADYQTRLPEHSLMLTDRLSMAHGLELRSPLLDHELVELLASFPANTKIRDRELKVILRQLGSDYLPKSIVERDKQGFMFPVAYWFRGPLFNFLCNFFEHAHLVEEGILQWPTIRTMLQDHRDGHVDHHVRLWMVLNLEIWYRLYIKQMPIESIQHTLQTILRNSTSS